LHKTTQIRECAKSVALYKQLVVETRVVLALMIKNTSFIQSRRVAQQCYLWKNVYWANVCFREHAFAQPCRHTTSEAFQVVKRLCDMYAILN